MHRPTGVTAIAAAFFLIAAYLMGVGVVMLVSQGKLPMLGGDPLLRGLQAGGPYATLLVGAIWGAIGWGITPAPRLGAVGGDGVDHIGSGVLGSTCGVGRLTFSLVVGGGRVGNSRAPRDRMVSLQDADRGTVLETRKGNVEKRPLYRARVSSAHDLSSTNTKAPVISRGMECVLDAVCETS